MGAHIKIALLLACLCAAGKASAVAHNWVYGVPFAPGVALDHGSSGAIPGRRKAVAQKSSWWAGSDDSLWLISSADDAYAPAARLAVEASPDSAGGPRFLRPPAAQIQLPEDPAAPSLQVFDTSPTTSLSAAEELVRPALRQQDQNASAGSGNIRLFHEPNEILEFPIVPGSSTDQLSDGRVDVIRDQLIRQLQRGVAQGMFEVPASEFPLAVAPSPGRGPIERDEPMPAPSPGPPSRRDHLNIQTAADRDAPLPIPGNPILGSASGCLSNEWFDVAGWNDVAVSANPARGLRDLQLLGEFDRIAEPAVTSLSRRYLALGFGAEARQVLDVFGVTSEESWVMREIAQVLDEDGNQPMPRLTGQFACQGPAALWAVLADPTLAGDVDLAIDRVLGAFSAMPLHLRNSLGPRLADAFIDAGMPQTAMTIRGMIERAPEASNAALELIDARLALARQDVRAASAAFQLVVAEDGPDAANALADLIDARVRQGLDIDVQMASSADALAVEHRGTELGKRLTLASIRALSISGQPETTFQRIAEAVTNASLSADEASDLTLETFRDAARNAKDSEFLVIAYRFPMPETGRVALKRMAKLEVAQRLLELGFAQKADEILGAEVTRDDQETVRLRAAIALGNGRPDQAISLLAADHSVEANAIRASAFQKNGEILRSARILASMGRSAEADILNWQAGEFAALAEMDDGKFVSAARLALTPPPAELMLASGGTEPPTAEPLTFGRKLVEDSMQVRGIIEDILQNEDKP